MKNKLCYVIGIIWGILTLLMLAVIFVTFGGLQSLFEDSILGGIIIVLATILFASTSILFIFIDEEPHIHYHTTLDSIGEKKEIKVIEPSPNNFSKQAKVFAIVICFFIVSVGAGGVIIYNVAYNKGYDIAKEEAKTNNNQNSYIKGYEDAKSLYYDSENTPGASSVDIPLNTAPESFVWVTPSGDKYHTKYCRYVNNRTDLTVYTGAQGAENDGYSPCSVCH